MTYQPSVPSGRGDELELAAHGPAARAQDRVLGFVGAGELRGKEVRRGPAHDLTRCSTAGPVGKGLIGGEVAPVIALQAEDHVRQPLEEGDERPRLDRDASPSHALEGSFHRWQFGADRARGQLIGPRPRRFTDCMSGVLERDDLVARAEHYAELLLAEADQLETAVDRRRRRSVHAIVADEVKP